MPTSTAFLRHTPRNGKIGFVRGIISDGPITTSPALFPVLDLLSRHVLILTEEFERRLCLRHKNQRPLLLFHMIEAAVTMFPTLAENALEKAESAHKVAFERIFERLQKPLHSDTDEDLLVQMLQEQSVSLPKFVRIVHRGQLLLHAAVSNGASLDIVRLLVEADEEDDNKVKPTLLAARTGDGMTPLHLSLQSRKAISQDKVIANYLLHADASRQSWNTPISMTASEQRGRYPLHLAAARGWTDICQTLLGQENHGAVQLWRADATHQTPLHLAAVSGVLETVQVCLTPEALMVRDQDGALPLHYSASLPILQTLLQADPGQTSWSARTKRGKTALLQLLGLPYDAQVTPTLLEQLLACDEIMLEEMYDGLTPVHLALCQPHCSVEMIRHVIRLAPIHVLILRCRREGNLPIHYAVTQGLAMTRLVTQADPTLLDVRNSQLGQTPLAVLVSTPPGENEESEILATVQYLVECNRYVAGIPDDAGNLPVDLARQAGQSAQVINLLEGTLSISCLSRDSRLSPITHRYGLGPKLAQLGY